MEQGQLQTGKRCQEKTLFERSGVSARTLPWLSPKHNTVDVVQMMVEGKGKRKKKVKKWALVATWLGATSPGETVTRKGHSVKSSVRTHSLPYFCV